MARSKGRKPWREGGPTLQRRAEGIIADLWGTEMEGDWAIVLAFAILPIVAIVQAVVS